MTAASLPIGVVGPVLAHDLNNALVLLGVVGDELGAMEFDGLQDYDAGLEAMRGIVARIDLLVGEVAPQPLSSNLTEVLRAELERTRWSGFVTVEEAVERGPWQGDCAAVVLSILELVRAQLESSRSHMALTVAAGPTSGSLTVTSSGALDNPRVGRAWMACVMARNVAKLHEGRFDADPGGGCGWVMTLSSIMR